MPRSRLPRCAFGPHVAAFRLEGITADPPGLSLTHCTVAAGGHSAVFDLGEGAGAAVEARHCLFARAMPSPSGDMGDEADTLLVRQADVRGPTTFQGTANRYYNLDAFWPAADGRAGDWKEFRSASIRSAGAGRKPLERRAALAPLERDASASRRTRPAPARGRRGPPHGGPAPCKTPSESRPNVRSCARSARRPSISSASNSLLAALTSPSCHPWRMPSPGQPTSGRVVDPDLEKDDPTNGLYAKLDQAVLAAKPGEAILIRKNGLLPLKLMTLEKGLILRAHEDYRPVLTLDDPRPLDAALFVVHDGLLQLEGLEFRLRPGRDDYKAQAVVALVGGGQCALKDCTVTLERAGQTALALATLSEASKAMMKMEVLPAKLTLDNCCVRGDGDLLVSRGGAPSRSRPATPWRC